MDKFVFQFFGWIAATLITLAVLAGFDVVTVDVVVSLTVAAIWAVVIWGGFLILDGDIFS